MYNVFAKYMKGIKMLLTVETISNLLKRDKNHSAIARKLGLSGNTVSNVARNPYANIDSKTLELLSGYFADEYDHMCLLMGNKTPCKHDDNWV